MCFIIVIYCYFNKRKSENYPKAHLKICREPKAKKGGEKDIGKKEASRINRNGAIKKRSVCI